MLCHYRSHCCVIVLCFPLKGGRWAGVSTTPLSRVRVVLVRRDHAPFPRRCSETTPPFYGVCATACGPGLLLSVGSPAFCLLQSSDPSPSLWTPIQPHLQSDTVWPLHLWALLLAFIGLLITSGSNQAYPRPAEMSSYSMRLCVGIVTGKGLNQLLSNLCLLVRCVHVNCGLLLWCNGCINHDSDVNKNYKGYHACESVLCVVCWPPHMLLSVWWWCCAPQTSGLSPVAWRPHTCSLHVVPCDHSFLGMLWDAHFSGIN